jgi:predicted ATPase
MEERFPEMSEAQPELLARHCTEAGMPERAVSFWRKAAEHAALRSAILEVIAHCDRGLDLLAELPENPSRDKEELALLLTLGPAEMVAKGFGKSESARHYKRARELAGKLGDEAALFTVTWGLWVHHQQRADIETARGLAEDVVAIARRQGDSAMELQAHHASWTTHLVLGDLPTVRKHVEKGIALYDVDKHGTHAFQYGGHDPGVCALVHAALTFWGQGYPDQAGDYSRRAIELAEKLSHPLSIAIAHALGGFVRQHRGEVAKAMSSAQQTIHVCSEMGIPHYLAVGHILHGWALAASGEAEQGIAEMLQGLEIYGETGAALRRSYYLTLLAGAYGMAGRAAEALKTIDDAYRAVDEVGELWWHAEVRRTRGQLLLAESAENSNEAEACFGQAIEIARSQSAKSLELRAATSLAQLWGGEGRRDEARQLLAPVHGWFTEGFETADLKDAKTLLGELA